MTYTGYDIEDIEDAMVSTLSADETLSAYVRTFERMPWEDIEALEKLLKNYPAIVVAYRGGDDDNSSYGVCDQVGKFAVLCAHKSVKSPSTAARGRGTAKGVYAMLKDVLKCLNYSNLGLDIISCLSSGVRVVAVSTTLTVFAREFTVTWRLTYV